MHFKQYITLSVILGLTACQSGDGPTKADAAQTSADISLRATSDIQTPSPIKAASFVPNSVATWLGHIILLDGKGILHRATTNSAKTDVVALGKYMDVIGLAREKKSGVFLALTTQGQIKAFIQNDEEGNYGPLAVSQGDETYERFCASSEPSSSTIWAKTTSHKSRKLTIEIFEGTSVSLTTANIDKEDIDPCSVNNALNLNGVYKIKSDNLATGFTLASEKEDVTVQITNGLSIGGIKNTGYVTATSINMGSVFNEGLMLVAEKDEGRLVLISRSYALKELEAR